MRAQRLYEGSKAVYKRAGVNAADAMAAARDREESPLVVKDEAVTAKVKVIEESGRVYLRRTANDFVRDPEQLQATEAAEIMRLVLELGLKCGPNEKRDTESVREEELMHLEWSDIHWDDSVLRVTSKPQWDFKIKDAKQRDIPIPNDLLSRLKGVA